VFFSPEFLEESPDNRPKIAIVTKKIATAYTKNFNISIIITFFEKNNVIFFAKDYQLVGE